MNKIQSQSARLKFKRKSSLLVAAMTALFASSYAVANDPVFISQEVSIAQSSITQSSVKVDELCRKISRKLHSVYPSDCLGNGFVETGGYSVEGSPIIVKEYPPAEDKKPYSKVLLIGGIHGDEYSSISIVFKWINTLDQFHSGMFHWRVVPLMNPDGLLRAKSQRMNSRGVDLNRNFPTPNWEEESRRYWIHKTKSNPRRYPGPSPLSEPESQWLAKYIEEFKPDVIVSVHAPYGILDFDGPKHPPTKLGNLYLNLLGTYPGSLGNFAGAQKDIPVVTIELPYAGVMPGQQQIKDIWMDLVQWLKRNSPDKDVPATQQVQREAMDVFDPS